MRKFGLLNGIFRPFMPLVSLPAYGGFVGSPAGLDAYTKILLHMNGSDGSTTFTDQSGKSWAANGNAQIDTAQSKFGGASGLFDGAGDWIDTPDHADFNVGSGDWTVDFWFRTSTTSALYLFGQADSALTAATIGIFGFIQSASNILRIGFYNTVPAVKFKDYSVAAADGNWHHFAGIRYGNNLYIAYDGTLSSAADVTGSTVQNSANKLSVGRLGEYATTPFNGWIDEFRFSAGIARWTSNFTPPSSQY
jgi:Concanavalin A-like lectin/glucanases superfamily